jgi:hypothetical protein
MFTKTPISFDLCGDVSFSLYLFLSLRFNLQHSNKACKRSSILINERKEKKLLPNEEVFVSFHSLDFPRLLVS